MILGILIGLTVFSDAVRLSLSGPWVWAWASSVRYRHGNLTLPVLSRLVKMVSFDRGGYCGSNPGLEMAFWLVFDNLWAFKVRSLV